MIKNYIIYEYLKESNDIKLLKQSIYILEIENYFKKLGITTKAKDNLTKDLENIKHLVKDKYIIFMEELKQEDY